VQYFAVNISEGAKQDLEDIFDYIFNNSKNFSIASNFVLKLNKALVKSLSFSPTKHPIYKNKIRKFVYPQNTNYVAYFEIFDETKEVIIHIITDTKQYTRYMNLS
jgi:plasmid stabilization system protein ParE